MTFNIQDDTSMSDSNNCEICGDSVLYGNRHPKCGRSVMAIEKERDELRTENEKLRNALKVAQFQIKAND